MTGDERPPIPAITTTERRALIAAGILTVIGLAAALLRDWWWVNFAALALLAAVDLSLLARNWRARYITGVTTATWSLMLCILAAAIIATDGWWATWVLIVLGLIGAACMLIQNQRDMRKLRDLTDRLRREMQEP